MVDREALLRDEFHQQTARIPWQDLQTYYARGCVVLVGEDLNLVDVAVQLAMDNTGQFEAWIARGEIAPVTEDQARDWFVDKPSFWAVVAPPWVLVQHT